MAWAISVLNGEGVDIRADDIDGWLFEEPDPIDVAQPIRARNESLQNRLQQLSRKGQCADSMRS